MTNDSKYYIDGVRAKDRRIIAKTITLIESAHPDHQVLAQLIVSQLLPFTGNSIRLGITGVPGAGKSTFIESFGMMLVEQDQHIAVLAIDPSSKRSGGSIMADKTRMEKLAAHPNAYIRPSPSSGTLGGVARKTRESMVVCEAAGFDTIIVETVGVGQSETTVASMVDFFLVLMLAGAGDEIQGIKKGLLELVDMVAINKADGSNRVRAKRTQKEFEMAMHLLRPATPSWAPPVLTCSAIEMSGIDLIWQNILKHRERLTASGELEDKRKKQTLDWMMALVEDGIKSRFFQDSQVQKLLPKLIHEVENGQMAPNTAAEYLLFNVKV
jgi:LAO/AO transport system kinase